MTEQPSEAKHTAGPWQIGGDGADIFAGGEAPSYATARHIADCQPGRPGLLGLETQDTANAQLIAAAPTMYAYVESQAKKGDSRAQQILGDVQ